MYTLYVGGNKSSNWYILVVMIERNITVYGHTPVPANLIGNILNVMVKVQAGVSFKAGLLLQAQLPVVVNKTNFS